MSDIEIWLVNDDPAQLLVQKRLLGRFAATVWDFQSPTELLAQAKKYGSCPNLVSDYNMPGLNGFQLSQIWCEMHAEARILLLSASHLSAAEREDITFLPQNRVKVLTAFRLPDFLAEARAWFAPSQEHPKDSIEKAQEKDSSAEFRHFETSMLEKLKRLGGSEFLHKALKRFADRIPLRMEVFEKALQEGNHRAIQSEAHSLKGSCGIVGAQSMLDLAGELEERALEKDELEKLQGLVKQLAEDWDGTKVELERILKQS